jgi:2-polyprenyl-3-methyl-5-hydroxy-6-metoxy-1,4-benzoquinol methylase
MICDDCDLIFTQQYLDSEKTNHMKEAETGDKYGEYKEQNLVNELDRKKFEIIFEQLEAHGSFQNIFDIGSAGGTFLEWASEKYSIVGHEYHKGLRNYCQKQGYDVRHEDLGSIELDQQFDLITSWDYLDHVINPKEMIANVTRFLKPGGLFFLAANNRDSLSMRMLHEHSPLILGPAHTMHFGLSQIQRLMEGYELVYAETYVSELNWLSNWLNFKNPEFGDAELMTQLLDPQKICELGMGLKLNVIFQKK